MWSASIYDSERFSGSRLRPETEELLNSKGIEKGEETTRLNRLLLEDAYPAELSRDLRCDDAMLELRKKLPPRRISLVQNNASLSHDITEPVQWLMH
jgi:hypothetical protein